MSENSNYVHVHDGSVEVIYPQSYTYSGTTGDFYTLPYTTDVEFFKSFNWHGIDNTINKNKENEDMRYLYEVILVNPKNDTFYETKVIARSDTSALLNAYNKSPFETILFDDLKTSCRVLMQWEKEKSLTKAIETIKKAVE